MPSTNQRQQVYHMTMLSGGSDQDYYEHDQVWELNTDTMEWSEVGNIGKARRSHAVTAVDINEYLQYCQQ